MVVSSDSYSEYIGKHAISTASNQSFQVTFAGDETEQVYRFCDQDYLERVSALLRFFQQEKDDWMSPDQQLLTYLFGILCVAVLVILGCVAIVFDAMPNFREEVGGVYVSCCLLLQSRFTSISFLTLHCYTTDDYGTRLGRNV